MDSSNATCRDELKDKPMLQISLEGQEALAERFGVLPDRLRAALAEKVDALAQTLFSQVVGVNLSGGVLNARSGALRDSIEVESSRLDDRIGAEIFSNGDAPYAAIQEFGGKTAAHEILPDKARVLAFVVNGKQVFARGVQHPGSQIPARSYLRSALDEQGDDIVHGLTETVSAFAEDLKGAQ
jgi:phage gpG-like protein